MAVNRGHRFKITASVVAVAGVLLFFANYKYSDLPESLPGERVADQYPQKADSPDERLPPVMSGELSVIDDYSRSEQDSYGYEAPVSIDVSDAGILLVAAEATLREVLDSIVDKAGVEIVDLRPDDRTAVEDKQRERQSFRISGSVDDVLRIVMDKYNYSYAISHLASAGSQSQSPVTKLFLYGVAHSEATEYADKQYLTPAGVTPAGAESIPVAGHTESEGSHGVDSERSAKEKVNVSELLRNRALSSAGSNSAQKHSLSDRSSSINSDRSSSINNESVSGSFDDESVRSSLTDMTRRASEGVRALAAGLKEAEKSLEAQRNNEYGESGQ